MSDTLGRGNQRPFDDALDFAVWLSDNVKAFVGDLIKELMGRSHIAQAHSTTYHPQTNGLEERQYRTIDYAQVYCLSYITDWDK